ncbi:MAG TPA: adenylate kinase [Dehalococcoidia bacterium]|nr:adenylate kinase [Dehalococcoidia bacterium]
MILGAPGAGKGTQATLLAQKLGLSHIATGDMFREGVRRGTELGLRAKEYMDRGQLVPDDIAIGMLLERLDEDDCRRGCILDGFPRTLEQARALDGALAKKGQAIGKVAYIRVSREEVVARLGGRLTCRNCGAIYHEQSQPPREAGRCDRCGGELYQREDDRPETVRKRLEVYLAQTAPLIEYYRQRGKLLEIDGDRSVEEVQEEILAATALEEGAALP